MNPIDLSNETLAHLKGIIEANNNKRLAIFVGAGISKNCKINGKTLPDWSDLIEDLTSDLSEIGEVDPLKIAQLYYQEFGEKNYYTKLKSYFPKNIAPSHVHQTIFKIKPHCIITTNWDEILEDEILNNGHIYDVVVNDEDLVKSTIDSKVIKMHGDFRHHNIVFKEDDYLEYPYNFPLIENFIKSILSTHTVLFIGYSYNDINLKHIVKWRQNLSRVAPPHYLISTRKDKHKDSIQSKYLEGHGIKVLFENNRNELLPLVLTPEYLVSTGDALSIAQHFYKSLSSLEPLNFIYLDMVLEALGNAKIVYASDGNAYLHLLQHDGYLTYDQDENKRELNTKFAGLLKQYEDSREKETDKGKDALEAEVIRYIEGFLRIVSKASIAGVIYRENENKTEFEYTSTNLDDKAEDKLFNFKWQNPNNLNKMELCYTQTQLLNYTDALSNVSDVIYQATQSKNYVLRMLATFNANVLIDCIKYDFTKNLSTKLKTQEKFDIEGWFEDLPKDLRTSLDSIFKVTTFDFLYKLAYEQRVELDKKEDAKRHIESGGGILHSDTFSSAIKHKSLLLFVLGNNLLQDHYNEYKNVIKTFLRIFLTRQFKKSDVEFSRTELYSCIRYLDTKELSLFLKPFMEGNNDTDLKKIQVSDKNKVWLLDESLEDITNLITKENHPFSTFNTYFSNYISILSLLKLSETEISSVLTKFKRVIDSNRSDINIYESLNNFLGVQYRLNNPTISNNDISNLIDSILYKFAYGEFNNWDIHAASFGRVQNIFGYASLNNLKYNNLKLLERSLLEIKQLDVTRQMGLSGVFLVNLMKISTKKINTMIQKYIRNIDYMNCPDSGNRLEFTLRLTLHEFKPYKELKEQIFTDLKDYYSQFEGKTQYSSLLPLFKTLLEKTYEKTQDPKLKKYIQKTNSIIEKYQEKEKTFWSI